VVFPPAAEQEEDVFLEGVEVEQDLICCGYAQNAAICTGGGMD
jgi:hypothetical protein